MTIGLILIDSLIRMEILEMTLLGLMHLLIKT